MGVCQPLAHPGCRSGNTLNVCLRGAITGSMTLLFGGPTKPRSFWFRKHLSRRQRCAGRGRSKLADCGADARPGWALRNTARPNGGRRTLSLTIVVAAASSSLGSKSAGAGLRKPPPSSASLPCGCRQRASSRPQLGPGSVRGCCAGVASSPSRRSARSLPPSSNFPSVGARCCWHPASLAGSRPLNPAAYLPVLRASPAHRSLQVAPGPGPS